MPASANLRTTAALAGTPRPDRRYHEQEHVNELGHDGAVGRCGTGGVRQGLSGAVTGRGPRAPSIHTARAAARLTHPADGHEKVPRPGERDASDPGRGTS